ncbi:DUF4248 domain-containing protein [Carboxylicivirga marina]|uniref:DUF4248 domain-containing protein n=1 Tax=Carboxylicivirga marina TaxID=2800988 RepID=UPI00338D454C
MTTNNTKTRFSNKTIPSNTTAAIQLLRKEIKASQELSSKLDKLTRNKRAHYFTHIELGIILKHFGISQEEFEDL